MKKALLAVTLLLFWASFAVAQRNGVATFSAADVHEFDTVNLPTLVPSFNFPVITKSQGALSGNLMIESPQICTEVSLHYASCVSSLNINSSFNPPNQPMLNTMPVIYTSTVVGSCTTYTITGLQGPDVLTTYSLPSTVLHNPSTCGTATATVTTNDGSGYTAGLSSVNGNPVVTSLSNTSGWTSSWGSTNTVTDPFSNSISSTSTAFTDSLGAVTTYLTNGWQYVDTTGANQDVTLTNGSALAFSPYSCSNTSGPTTFIPVTSINYPDSTKISIGWDKNGSNYSGLIGSITLRTGGQISYTYHVVQCSPFYNSTLARTTADGTWNYSLTTAANSTTTTVKDPGLNKTVYVFVGSGNLGTGSPAPSFTSTIDRYQNTGTVASPSYTHISETSYCYNTHISDCATYIPAYPITQLDTYQYTYNGATQVTMSHDVKLYDSTYGLLTSDAATDSITSQTITTTYVYGTYSSGSCSAITNTKIVDHPCTITTKNGTTWLSGSTYTYNTNGALTSSSQCLSSTCTGSSALTTTYTPTTQGTYSAIQDPNGQTVNYTYGSCNSLMPTDVTTTVNSIAIDHKATWNCNAGVVTDTTDPNSNEDDYTYDSMNRISTYHDYMGDTNTTTYDYGTPTLDHVKVTDNIGVVSYQYNDGLGRPTVSQTCQTSGCTNLDTVSMTYGWKDSGNNALTNFQTTTSVPCVTTAVNSTCSTVAVTALTNPIAGPYKTTDYNSGTGTYAVNSKDFSFTAGPAPSQENTKVVQTEIDGFGRITSTCALESSGGTSCGQTMGNSGILTSNTYSFATGAPKVVTTRGSQSHTIVADALGRTTSITLPETGATARTFSYDSQSSSDACTSSSRTSNGDLLRNNLPDGTNYVCYIYDGLHRLTDVGNSGTSHTINYCKRFRYDSTANKTYTAPTGYPASPNIIGRLMEASTDDCNGTKITDEWFAYDAMGRITDMFEDTTNSGGYYHTTAAYDADGVMTTLSGVPGYSNFTFGTDGEDRWNSSKFGTTTIVSATAGSGFKYDAASRPTNVPTGTAGDQDAYTYDNVGNMTGYTFTVNSKAMAGALTWNSIGSLNKLVITDAFNSGGAQTCTYGTSTVEGYDDVGRLLDANCGASIQHDSWTYDQYDNATRTGNPGTSWNPGYSSTTNQYTLTGATYDSNGNVTYDGVNTYTWDLYGMMYGARSGNNAPNCSSAGNCDTRDAFGRVVDIKVNGSVYGQILFGPIGRMGNMNGQTTVAAYIPQPGGGKLYATGSSGSGVNFSHTDWLGTVRLGTSISAQTENFDTAFTPYGESYDSFGTVNQDFTGDLQDAFGGVFDTPNRELMTNASRWLSPDPAHSGWNAYAYVTDPNTQTDPSGLGPQDLQNLCPGCDDLSNLNLSGGCNLPEAACIDPPCCTATAIHGTGSLDLGPPSINSGFTVSGEALGQFGEIRGGGSAMFFNNFAPKKLTAVGVAAGAAATGAAYIIIRNHLKGVGARSAGMRAELEARFPKPVEDPWSVPIKGPGGIPSQPSLYAGGIEYEPGTMINTYMTTVDGVMDVPMMISGAGRAVMGPDLAASNMVVVGPAVVFFALTQSATGMHATNDPLPPPAPTMYGWGWSWDKFVSFSLQNTLEMF